jgi:hypothetical protein
VTNAIRITQKSAIKSSRVLPVILGTHFYCLPHFLRNINLFLMAWNSISGLERPKTGASLATVSCVIHDVKMTGRGRCRTAKDNHIILNWDYGIIKPVWSPNDRGSSTTSGPNRWVGRGSRSFWSTPVCGLLGILPYHTFIGLQ